MDMETLRRLAALGRLGCTSAELEALLPDMEKVTTLLDQIREFPGQPEEAGAPQYLDMLREDRPAAPDDGKDASENTAAGSSVFWTPRIV